jgi:hypothetical protein
VHNSCKSQRQVLHDRGNTGPLALARFILQELRTRPREGGSRDAGYGTRDARYGTRLGSAPPPSAGEQPSGTGRERWKPALSGEAQGDQLEGTQLENGGCAVGGKCGAAVGERAFQEVSLLRLVRLEATDDPRP